MWPLIYRPNKAKYSLTHLISLNKLPNTTYWKSPITIIGMFLCDLDSHWEKRLHNLGDPPKTPQTFCGT